MREPIDARGRSIVATVTWLNLCVAGLALVLAAGALALYDRTSFRERTIRHLSAQAQIIGAVSLQALHTNDVALAQAMLAALAAAPHVIGAELRTADHQLLASYQREGAPAALELPPLPEAGGEVFRYGTDQLVLARPILSEAGPVGSVLIRSDLEELTERRAQFIAMMALVLAASLLAAWFMSRWAQGTISTPIVSLASTAKTVTEGRDYSVRADVGDASQEVLVLTRAFNDMLSEIQRRDASLQEAHDALEARVAARTAELTAVNQELEAFTYSVSHDLRAPLRHVIGYAELLGEHAGRSLDAPGQRYLQTITQAAKRMSRLIDDLLDFARMGREPLTTRQVNLEQLVVEAQEDATPVGQPASREIEWRINPLPRVPGDAAMLRVVLVNLLSNAVKYSSLRPVARIEVGAEVNDRDGWVVFVRDNGVGFDMQYANKLFGVFQRLHSANDFEGTGIGLAHVRRIVQRHGGRVWAEGVVDQGATFYFSLPMGAAET